MHVSTRGSTASISMAPRSSWPQNGDSGFHLQIRARQPAPRSMITQAALNDVPIVMPEEYWLPPGQLSTINRKSQVQSHDLFRCFGCTRSECEVRCWVRSKPQDTVADAARATWPAGHSWLSRHSLDNRSRGIPAPNSECQSV